MSKTEAILPTADYLRAPDATARQLDHLPGDFGLPVVGKVPALVGDFYGTVRACHQKYGPVSKINIGFRPGVLVLEPELFKQVLMDQEQNFSSRMGYGKLSHWFDSAILFRDFDEHRLHRRVFQTAFKVEAMRGYVSMMHAIIDSHLGLWGNLKGFRAVPNIQVLLMNIAARVFYGIENLDNDESARLGVAFRQIVVDGLQALVRIDLPPFKWHNGLKGKRYVSEYIGSLITQRREADGSDFMSYLVKAKTTLGEYLTDQELTDHLNFLFFAAFDTTTTALSHLLMHLAVDQSLQTRLREQCQSIGKSQLEYEDLSGMEGLENAVYESLRLYPSASILMRRTLRDCELGGQRIPENSVLFLPPMFNHRMEGWWENPSRFDPDRFAPPRQEHKRHAYLYAPFGGGAHKCIGMNFALMNSKLIMYRMLLDYRFRTPDGYVAASRTLPLPKPVKDLPLILERLR